MLAARSDMNAWFEEVGSPVIPTTPLNAGLVKSFAFVGTAASEVL